MIAALGADDASVRQKQVADLARCLEQAARVVAQIEDQAAHALVLQFLDRLAHLLARRLAETGQTDVADLVFLVEHEVPGAEIVGLAPIAEYARHLDDGPRDGYIDRFLGALVQHGQRHGLPRLALDQIDGLVHAHVLGRFAVDLDDEVAGQDAGLVGRRAGHRADDRQLAAVLAIEADLNADAAELALALLLELLVLARRDVRRVRIEPFESAVDHVLDQFAFALRLDVHDVAFAHLVQHVHHEADQFVVLVLLAGGGAVGDGDAEQGHGGDAQQPVQVPA